MNDFKDAKKILIERDGYRCSICGSSNDELVIDHIFPRALGGTEDITNLRLLCKKCNSVFVNTAFSAYEFQKYVYDIITKSKDFRNVEIEVAFGKDKEYMADIVAEGRDNNQWKSLLIEVKFISSLTIDRVEKVIEKFKELNQIIKNKRNVLLFPGKLTEKASLLLQQNNIEVWDIEYLSHKFLNEIRETKHPIFQSLLIQNNQNLNKTDEEIFIDKLRACRPGKDDWSKYQRLIGEILAFLFCPPLLLPLSEKADALKINRRDFILPNYCDVGFWAFLRSRYCADYIVVDAKNYSKKVTKKEVLQIANYLKLHGTGLFGIIISRNGLGESALYTLREVWAIEKKLIIILEDNDIEQMLLEKSSGREPENVIRQKIEDFRLLL